MLLGQLAIQMQKKKKIVMNFGPYLAPYTKIN